MNALKREHVVVSVGGSLIVPDSIDTDFLSSFRTFILSHVEKGFSFSIIAGGGKTARSYLNAAEKICGDLPREDLDWLGIHATRLNGHLLRTIFREDAHHILVKDPADAAGIEDRILIAAGWQPGWSTDYCAVMIAKALGAKKLANLSNVDFVYDKDPKRHTDAKKIERLSWGEFRTLIPDHWDPGLSSPFDPVAAREAEEQGLEVAIMNGASLDRFAAYLDGKPFMGTVIS
jgi:uridylate kinase